MKSSWSFHIFLYVELPGKEVFYENSIQYFTRFVGFNFKLIFIKLSQMEYNATLMCYLLSMCYIKVHLHRSLMQKKYLQTANL